MEPIDRRRFLGSAAGAAAALSATGGLRVAVSADRPSDGAIASDRPPAPPMIQLGKTKIKMSRLGQGTGVHGGKRQSEQTKMGFAKLALRDRCRCGCCLQTFRRHRAGGELFVQIGFLGDQL